MKSSSTKGSKQALPKAENELNDGKSSFGLLWCKMTFTNEPLWFRLVAMLILLGATVAIVYLLKEWALVTALGKKLSTIKIKDIIDKIKLH